MGILSMSALVRTPVMVMPVIWLLVLSWRRCANEPLRWRFLALWAGLSFPEADLRGDRARVEQGLIVYHGMLFSAPPARSTRASAGPPGTRNA